MEKHKTLSININDITEDKKSTFRKKAIFSIYIVTYVLVALIFLLFSSNYWVYKMFGSDEILPIMKFSFSLLFLLMFAPIISGIVFEINKLFFGKYNKRSFFILLSIAITYIVVPNIIYSTFVYFNRLERLDDDWMFRIFVITLTALTAGLFLINIFLIKRNHMSDIREIICFFAITFFSIFGTFSLTFIGMSKSWLTLIYFFMITSLSDTFAYVGGMLFGKRKLSPNISPKKTWEGFIFGAIVTTGIALLVFMGISQDEYSKNQLLHFTSLISSPEWAQWLFMFSMIFVISIVSTLGDLFYSYIKRLYKIKDYSAILKEHGGVLDRFDSVLICISLYTIALFFFTGLSSDVLFVIN